MKAHLILTTAIAAFLTLGISCSEAYFFSIKPGLDMQSSSIGISIGRTMPYAGVDVFAIEANASKTQIEWRRDKDGIRYKSSVQTQDLHGSAILLIPHLGIKVVLPKPDKKLRLYFIGDFFKTFPFVDADYKCKKTQYNKYGVITYENTNEKKLQGKEKKFLTDLLSICGVTIGFGAEYPLSEHFSISGETGLRWFFTSIEHNDNEPDNWNNDWRNEWKNKLSGSLALTYTAVALNFYF